NPKAWQTRYALGIALLQSGNSGRAARELQAVIEQQPDAFMAHNALGLALENLGTLEDAREQYEAAVRLDPSFALGYYNLAHLASMQTRPIAAVYYAQKAVSLEPREPQFELALGIAYSQNDKLQQSVEVLRGLIVSNPDFVEAYINLGTVY